MGECHWREDEVITYGKISDERNLTLGICGLVF